MKLICTRKSLFSHDAYKFNELTEIQMKFRYIDGGRGSGNGNRPQILRGCSHYLCIHRSSHQSAYYNY